MPRHTLHRALNGFRTSRKRASSGGDEAEGVEEASQAQSIEELLTSDEAAQKNRESLANETGLNSPLLGCETSFQAPLGSDAAGAVSNML